jgi:hypothetical protein
MPYRADAFVMAVPAIPAHAMSPQRTSNGCVYFAFRELVLFCEMLLILLQSPTREATFHAIKVLVESDRMRAHSDPMIAPVRAYYDCW